MEVWRQAPGLVVVQIAEGDSVESWDRLVLLLVGPDFFFAVVQALELLV